MSIHTKKELFGHPLADHFNMKHWLPCLSEWMEWEV